MDNENTKRCFQCAYYSAYYKNGFYKFDKQNHGFCGRRDTEVKNRDTCMYWQKDSTRKKMRHDACLRALETAFNSIIEIKQILSEEHEDNEIDIK